MVHKPGVLFALFRKFTSISSLPIENPRMTAATSIKNYVPTGEMFLKDYISEMRKN